MQRSKERIQNLGFFKKVEVTNAPGSAPDRTVDHGRCRGAIDRRVVARRRLFHLRRPARRCSASASAISSAAARTCGIGTVLSFRSQQVDLSFTEPYFLDKNIAAGVDLFEIKTSPTTNFFTGVTPAYQQILLWRRAARRLSDHRKSAPDLEIHGPFRQHHQCRRATPRCSFSCRRARTRPRRSARCCCTTAATTGSSRPTATTPRSATTSPAWALASSTCATRSMSAITIRLRRSGC